MTPSFERHVERVIAAVADPSAGAKSRLTASWCRSFQTHSLDPSWKRRPDRITASELQYLKGKNEALIRAASSTVDHLFDVLRLSGCAVFLADRDGCVLLGRSSVADAGDFESCNLAPGADWSEAAEGTNGIGTCLGEVCPVTIRQDEHFSARNISMTCIGAPVFGPTGELVGVLDISSARRDHSACLNGLMAETVAQAARNIETTLFRHAYPNARITVSETSATGQVGLLAIDQDDVITGATRGARRALGFSQEQAFAPVPAGDILGGDAARTGFDRAEYAALKRALLRANGNASQAARALGIGRATLYRRMKRVGLYGSDGKVSQH